MVIIISRRPDAIINPQFWAEDGAIWFADAYNFGSLKPMFIAKNGYYQTVPRLTAAIAQIFPLKYVPLFFNLTAIAIQLLPILLIFSLRFERLIPKLSTKIIVVLVYLLMPNISEVYINISNAQWFLALSASLIIFYNLSQNSKWHRLDLMIVFLSSISGPFVIFWFPFVLFNWIKLRNNFALQSLIVVSMAVIVQLIALLSLGRVGFGLPLGAGWLLFYKIFSRQIIWGSLIGPNGYFWIIDKIPWHALFFAITTALSVLIIFFAMLKAPRGIKFFSLFGGLNFFAGLINPTMINGIDKPVWQVLSGANGIRYWFLPMIGFLVILFWGARKTVFLPVRLMSIFFLTCMVLFTIKTFRHPENFRFTPYIDFHYQKAVKEFLALPKGEKMAIPINPPGWQMELIKKE